MTVFPMVVGSALCMLLGSLLTRPPSPKTLDRYFPPKESRRDAPLAGKA
jgi:hypothetical protein